MYVCMYVCMHTCIHACMHVCIYVHEHEAILHYLPDNTSVSTHVPSTVEMASGQVCSESTFLVPSSRSGYLSSHIALETNRGSQDCPWLIRTDPGRRVVINLIDFDYGQAERTNSMSNEYELCTVYAIVRERNTPSGVTVCAGTVRNKTVYTSVSHMVEVQILGRRGSFLLKYEGRPSVVI